MSEENNTQIDDIEQSEKPTGEAAQMLYDLMISEQLFLEYDVENVYVGKCDEMTVQLNCKESYFSIDGREKTLTRADTHILCQEVAKQASIRLAKIKKNNLERLRKIMECKNC
jgi:hypothetical protein